MHKKNSEVERMNFILGGGVAGLIAAFYNQSFKIISPELGGQPALGPRLIQKHPKNHKLLYDLGFRKFKVKTAKIGFFYKGKLHDTCPTSLRMEYYEKTRQVTCAKIPKSIMSDDKKTIDYYDVIWEDLIKALVDKVKNQWIKAKVNNITEKGIIFDNKYHEYKKLISTIPAPIFFKLKKQEEENLILADYRKHTFSAVDKSFGLASSPFDGGNYDYIYFPDKKIEISRATKINEDSWLYEKTGKHRGMQVLPRVQIKHNADFGKTNNIKFIGRYAQWKHGVNFNK